MRKLTLLLVLIALVGVMVAPSHAQDSSNDSIADILVASANADSPEFTTLLTAVQATSLTPLLDQGGPYTVFAPTDAAFEASLTELGLTVDDLLADPDLLTSYLLYHIVPGSFMDTHVVEMDGLSIATAYWGSTLDITVAEDGSSVMVDGATITSTNIFASNGVVHVIDRVLLPSNDEGQLEGGLLEGDQTVVDIAVGLSEAEEPQFTTLVELVIQAELTGALGDGGPFTIFAPTDEAFAAFLEENPDVSPEDVLNTLLYHVVPLNYFAADVTQLDGALVGTLLPGSALVIRTEDGVMVNGANVIETNVVGSNGVIHVIDAVLPVETISDVAARLPAEEVDAEESESTEGETEDGDAADTEADSTDGDAAGDESTEAESTETESTETETTDGESEDSTDADATETPAE